MWFVEFNLDSRLANEAKSTVTSFAPRNSSAKVSLTKCGKEPAHPSGCTGAMIMYQERCDMCESVINIL